MSALIAGGTLFVVDKRNDEAERTVNDIQQRALEYQRDVTKAMTENVPPADADAAQAQREAAEIAAEAQADADELIEETNEAIEDAID
ncbi:hypothetical protein [Solirubrobacter deserti]|uniref:YtxH domain-containing protein n=1 Tax=Solirubrobacter deserti TaxID=2282478 RepID=A0ABT4REX7_9ACTN|nr:hypothetical protein [Solirubrobacter deserti]MDA0137093.1 hypothetical protein [Solirubrobacter deserti]